MKNLITSGESGHGGLGERGGAVGGWGLVDDQWMTSTRWTVTKHVFKSSHAQPHMWSFDPMLLRLYIDNSVVCRKALVLFLFVKMDVI